MYYIGIDGGGTKTAFVWNVFVPGKLSNCKSVLELLDMEIIRQFVNSWNLILKKN